MRQQLLEYDQLLIQTRELKENFNALQIEYAEFIVYEQQNCLLLTEKLAIRDEYLEEKIRYKRYIHAYIHTYIHTHIYTFTHTCKS